MFRSATLKLTAFYIGILVFICVLFSTALYRALVQEFTRNFVAQSEFLATRPQFRTFLNDSEAQEFRLKQFEHGKRQIIYQILLVDFALLAVGGFASYFLARRTLEPIETAHEAQARFTADASHELRTPLSVMQTEIEVALRSPSLKAADAKALLESNLEEVATLRQLTDGLLTLARGTESSNPLKKQLLEPAIKTAVERVKKQATAKHIRLAAEIAKKLSATFESSQLIEIVVILLDNAIKYSHEKSHIGIKAYQSKEGVIILVEDNGIGMNKVELARAFERFYRADSARSKQGTTGHGLGLSIASGLAEQIQAELSLASTKGKGTRATLKLQP